MRQATPPQLEKHRLRDGPLASIPEYGLTGAFLVPGPCGKDLFWEPEDVVMQLHPQKSTYVNFNPHTLHLWRPKSVRIPTPPVGMVGPVGVSGH
jgi:hypothetical protein